MIPAQTCRLPRRRFLRTLKFSEQWCRLPRPVLPPRVRVRVLRLRVRPLSHSRHGRLPRRGRTMIHYEELLTSIWVCGFWLLAGLLGGWLAGLPAVVVVVVVVVAGLGFVVFGCGGGCGAAGWPACRRLLTMWLLWLLWLLFWLLCWLLWLFVVRVGPACGRSRGAAPAPGLGGQAGTSIFVDFR